VVLSNIEDGCINDSNTIGADVCNTRGQFQKSFDLGKKEEYLTPRNAKESGKEDGKEGRFPEGATKKKKKETGEKAPSFWKKKKGSDEGQRHAPHQDEEENGQERKM